MVTTVVLEKRIKKLEKQLANTIKEPEAAASPSTPRKVKKNLKRTQRKLRKYQACEKKASGSPKGDETTDSPAS